MKAAEGGHTDAALLLIDSAADVNVSKSTRIDSVVQSGVDSPLAFACVAGDVPLVKALIDAGASPPGKNDILRAWANGHDEVVHQLFSIPPENIKNQADVREAAKLILLKSGETHPVLAVLLMDRWVDVDDQLNPSTTAGRPVGKVPQRTTPLCIAMRTQDSSLLEYLLNRGVKIDLPPSEFYGISSARNVELLLDAAPDFDFNYQDRFGTTALQQVESPEVARLLLAHGRGLICEIAPVNQRLDMALERGNLSLVKVYLEFMDQPAAGMMTTTAEDLSEEIRRRDLVPADLFTLLKVAVALDRPALIDAVLSSGFQVSKPLNKGRLLQIAANCDAVAALRHLIEQVGFDVESKNEYGATALYMASVNSNTAALSVLIELDADVSATFDLPPLYWAADQGNLEVMRLLLAAAAPGRARPSRQRGHAKWTYRCSIHADRCRRTG